MAHIVYPGEEGDGNLVTIVKNTVFFLLDATICSDGWCFVLPVLKIWPALSDGIPLSSV